MAGLQLKKIILRFVSLWLILSVAFLFITHKVNYFKKQLFEIETNWKNAEPLLKERDSLVARRQDLGNFLLLLKQGFKRDILWSQKLSALTYLVPDEVWLRQINFTKDELGRQQLGISASVSYLRTDEELLAKINAFVEDIRKDKSFFKEFQDISLLEINKTRGPAQENIMEFKLVLSLKQEQ